MSKQLPLNPSLRSFQNQAKQLLKAYQSGSSATVKRLRAQMDRFAKASDTEILSASLTLRDMQQLIGREYGFESWFLLKRHVDQASKTSTLSGGSALATTRIPPSEFFEAVSKLNILRVKELLEEDPSLVDADAWGPSALDDTLEPHQSMRVVHFAAYGHAELLKLLIDYGVDVDALGYEDNHGVTPALVLTCWEGTLETLSLFLEAGANPNIPAIPGGSALHAAINHFDPQKIELLLQYGARHDIFSAAAVGDLEEVKRQLAPPGGAWLLNRHDVSRDRSPLGWAVFHKQEAVAEFLITLGAEMTPQDLIGLGKIDEIKPLVESDPEFVNRPLDALEETPLVCAIRCRHLELMKYLLSVGADPNGPDGWDQMPLVHAGDAEYVIPLIEAGAKVNLDPRGRTILSGYLLGDDFEVADILLQYGADPELRTTGKGGTTALQHLIAPWGYEAKERARKGEFLPAMRFLLDHGAAINTVSDEGKTALDYAIEKNCELVADFLRERGGKPVEALDV